MPMTIKQGDSLPDAQFRVMSADGPMVRTTSDVFGGRKVVLFAVPGAFTPTCHKNHMPGFVAKADEIKAKGVDAILVTAVNDVFVMDAWTKQSGSEGKIEYLADGNGEFARAVDLTVDASGNGLGIRSKRYAMVVEDGVIKTLNVEDSPGKAEVSSAENLLKAL
jgi:glutaredoxin/glutathione-dependent peroxiredoxin